MTEERITRTQNPDGSTSTTHTTVISDRGNGGGGKWVFLIIVAIAALFGAYFLTQMSGAEIAKDDAVANAAEQVGDAANKVGDAAQDAVDKIAE